MGAVGHGVKWWDTLVDAGPAGSGEDGGAYDRNAFQASGNSSAIRLAGWVFSVRPVNRIFKFWALRVGQFSARSVPSAK